MINLDLSFVIQIINVLVLLLLLNVFLYKPIRKALADRDAKISGARTRAAEVEKDVQEKMALYEARLREAKTKANEERNLLRKEAMSEEAEILGKVRKEAAESMAAIRSRVLMESSDAKEFLREQARALSLQICEKVLGRSL